MFGVKNKSKEEQIQSLSDDLKRKISEIYLKIQSGDLSEEEMAKVKTELEKMKEKLETKMIRVSAASAKPAQA